jgi:hypothetical protein
MQGNWVVEICEGISKIEVTGDVCLRSPGSTQGCRADYDDYNDDYNDDNNINNNNNNV